MFSFVLVHTLLTRNRRDYSRQRLATAGPDLNHYFSSFEHDITVHERIYNSDQSQYRYFPTRGRNVNFFQRLRANTGLVP
jgi:hypothetical protein